MRPATHPARSHRRFRTAVGTLATSRPETGVAPLNHAALVPTRQSHSTLSPVDLGSTVVFVEREHVMLPSHVTFSPTDLYRQYHSPMGTHTQPESNAMDIPQRQSPSPPPIVRPLKLSPPMNVPHSPDCFKVLVESLQPEHHTEPEATELKQHVPPAMGDPVRSVSFNGIGNAQTTTLCQTRDDEALSEATKCLDTSAPADKLPPLRFSAMDCPRPPQTPTKVSGRDWRESDVQVTWHVSSPRRSTTSCTACTACGQPALWCDCAPSAGSGYVRL
jgi:hypothetical protein